MKEEVKEITILAKRFVDEFVKMQGEGKEKRDILEHILSAEEIPNRHIPKIIALASAMNFIDVFEEDEEKAVDKTVSYIWCVGLCPVCWGAIAVAISAVVKRWRKRKLDQRNKTVEKLREEKRLELEQVIARIKKLEEEVNSTRWNHDNKNMHVGKLRELDVLYLRRRELKDFLKEVDGKRLLTKSDDVMRFDEMR